MAYSYGGGGFTRVGDWETLWRWYSGPASQERPALPPLHTLKTGGPTNIMSLLLRPHPLFYSVTNTLPTTNGLQDLPAGVHPTHPSPPVITNAAPLINAAREEQRPTLSLLSLGTIELVAAPFLSFREVGRFPLQPTTRFPVPAAQHQEHPVAAHLRAEGMMTQTELLRVQSDGTQPLD